MHRSLHAILALSLTCLLLLAASPAEGGTHLLRAPDISQTQVVFAYAGDLWTVDREGGAAERLTSFPGIESDARFSPDGRMIAFSGEYDGNVDVYVVPADGGEPKRLTWHPIEDEVRGWTPDGRNVIFASGREGAPESFPKLWRISLEGGMPVALSVPRAWRGELSIDGKRLAYQRVQPWETEFRNYRGGQNGPIRVIDLGSLEETVLPWSGANDNTPVWLGETVYYLSDADLAMNVWACAPGGTPRQVTHYADFDVKSLNAGGGLLVFEQGGTLHTLDPAGGEPRDLEITAEGDFPWARPHWENVGSRLESASLSPSGKRALFAARGEILTVPAEKGDARDLTESPGVRDRAPAWSPDGRSIAWFCDESGEYALEIADQFGEHRRTIALEHPTFFFDAAWSPDSKQIAFTDADRNLWIVDAASGRSTKVDCEGFAHPERIIYPAWSPDSRWVAYAKRLPNEYAAVFVYSLEEGRTHQVTDGMSDSRAPAWDASGRYLYFLASTDFGPNVGWLDLSSHLSPVTRSIYLAVLAADEPSPLLPESDEEDVAETEEDGKGDAGKQDAEESGDGEAFDEAAPPEVRIDFDGLAGRILALDIPPGDYRQLVAGEQGVLFYTEALEREPGLDLQRWNLEERESTPVVSGVAAFAISADGKKLLYGTQDDVWTVFDAAGEPAAGEGVLTTAGLQVKVDPPAEWRQILHEAVRFERDYFYVRNVHGLDLAWFERAYGPWLADVRHRSDLSYLLDILGGEASIGHSFTFGGDMPEIDHVPIGLLGADLVADHGRYRIARIYTGESWNPDLHAPLAAPGVDVHVGDYLITVDGRELTDAMNPYSLFDRTAGRQTRLTVNAEPKADGAREVTVVPVASEGELRRASWIEGNRSEVDRLSGGRLAYVWLPDTGQDGFDQFNRYYFAQKNRKGAVIDERWNGGGAIADYVVDLLSRPLMGYFNNPLGDRQPWTAPNAALFGPKVMIINESAGSGGDMLPYMFRFRKIGPLVGTRTWGGLVGIWDTPLLMDGGFITAPRGGFFNVEGRWDVENKGIAPDVTVEMEPKLVHAGRDPQLEKAVEVALERLKTEEVELRRQPPDPVRVARPKR